MDVTAEDYRSAETLDDSNQKKKNNLLDNYLVARCYDFAKNLYLCTVKIRCPQNHGYGKRSADREAKTTKEVVRTATSGD